MMTIPSRLSASLTVALVALAPFTALAQQQVQNPAPPPAVRLPVVPQATAPQMPQAPVVSGAAGAGQAAQGQPAGSIRVLPSLPPKVAEEADRLGRGYLARVQPKAPSVDLTLAEGYAARERFLATAMPSRPAQIGWKVMLTARTSQEMFGIREPVAGRIFAGQINETGAGIARDIGARASIEVDLAVTVKDAGIMQATNPIEAAAHIASIAGYLDVPDLLLAAGEPLTAGTLAMINAGVRAGVIGKPVAMQTSPDFVAALSNLTVRTTDGHNGAIVESRTSAILGHPLNAVVWLVGHLKARGESLKPGDVIALGSLSRPLPLKEGQTVRAAYAGLPGNGGFDVQLSVR